MNSKWEDTSLQDVTTIIGDGLHGTPIYNDEGDFFFINGNNLSKGRISLHEKTRKCDEQEYLKYKKDLTDRTILISINGTLGNIALYRGEKVFLGKSACYLNIKNNINKIFIRYVLENNSFQLYLQSQATGSTIKNASLKLIRSYRFKLPLLKVQQKIAKILGDLDDKIEINNQINETLEAMAQAIFKSWFVDFDPVRAKAEAKAAGKDDTGILRAAMAVISSKSEQALAQMAQDSPEEYKKLEATAQAFPDAFVESELGLIPEGWEVKSLDEIAEYHNGLALQKFRPENDKEYLPIVKIAQLRAGEASHEEKAALDIKETSIIDNGDVVFSWSGTLLVDIWCGGKAALNQHLFKVVSNKFPKWFYYFYTKHHLEAFQRIANDKAVTMGHIKRSHLTEALCSVPEDLSPIESKIINILQLQITNRLQNKTLAELRDSLLPKLLSGEIEV